MKRKILISALLILIVVITVFTYNRYKTKRIEHLIGANQLRIEEVLEFPNDITTLDRIDLEDLDNRVKKIINSENLSTNKPILRYTMTGMIRKHVFWLLDQGEGYYVVEAIDTNK